MKKVTLMAIAILLCGTAVFAAHPTNLVPDTAKTKKVKPAKVQYTCPMHPKVLSDKPGKCPICGETMVKKVPGKKPATMKM
jgi:hypothetical protein